MPVRDQILEIKKEYYLLFPLAKVYSAWVSSDTVIEPATSMDINPVVGGHYRLNMELPDFSSSNEGTFSLVEPERHIRYSWEWNHDGEVTEIDVRFSAADGATKVEILHQGFTKEESVTNHDSGWDSYIAGLTEHLSTA